ncbi:MAG: hypothetical protein ACRDRP_00370 [Pseudonocardiaceae bacterium]
MRPTEPGVEQEAARHSRDQLKRLAALRDRDAVDVVSGQDIAQPAPP